MRKTPAILALAALTLTGCGTTGDPQETTADRKARTEAIVSAGQASAAADPEPTPDEKFTAALAAQGIFPTDSEQDTARLDCLTDGGGSTFQDIVGDWERRGYSRGDAEAITVATFTEMCSWPVDMRDSVPVKYADL